MQPAPSKASIRHVDEALQDALIADAVNADINA
jgi:hypothetical protein